MSQTPEDRFSCDMAHISLINFNSMYQHLVHALSRKRDLSFGSHGKCESENLGWQEFGGDKW